MLRAIGSLLSNLNLVLHADITLQAMLSGGGFIQVPANRISPVPSHMYPPGRPGSREERPSSRDSWQSPRPSSRPSSRDSNISGGRPSSRESPRTDIGVRNTSPAREVVPSRQLHQLLTQNHPVQILAAQGIQVVHPSQPAGQVHSSTGADHFVSTSRPEQLSQKNPPGVDQRRYLSPTHIIRGLSPTQSDQLRRESAPNILRRVPSPHQQLRRDSAPNTNFQAHPKIKIEDTSPPRQSTKKAPIPNPFFRGLKLPVQVSQQPQESLQISQTRAKPTSAEVTATQVRVSLYKQQLLCNIVM